MKSSADYWVSMNTEQFNLLIHGAVEICGTYKYTLYSYEKVIRVISHRSDFKPHGRSGLIECIESRFLLQINRLTPSEYHDVYLTNGVKI